MSIDNNLGLRVEDFDLSDFDDPIKLLTALCKKQSVRSTSSVLQDNCIQIGQIDFTDKCFTISSIAKHYGVPTEKIRSAMKARTLKPVAYIPLFAADDIVNFLEKQNDIENPLFQAFLFEVQNMRVNYSYKPVLLLAIMDKANTTGEVTISDIVDYFVNFYAGRQEKGFLVEKPDSSFVKHPLDRTKAKRTIITYPVKIFVERSFISYNKTTDVISVTPTIWNSITSEMRAQINKFCTETLEKYYATISIQGD